MAQHTVAIRAWQNTWSIVFRVCINKGKSKEMESKDGRCWRSAEQSGPPSWLYSSIQWKCYTTLWWQDIRHVRWNISSVWPVGCLQAIRIQLWKLYAAWSVQQGLFIQKFSKQGSVILWTGWQYLFPCSQWKQGRQPCEVVQSIRC